MVFNYLYFIILYIILLIYIYFRVYKPSRHYLFIVLNSIKINKIIIYIVIYQILKRLLHKNDYYYLYFLKNNMNFRYNIDDFSNCLKNPSEYEKYERNTRSLYDFLGVKRTFTSEIEKEKCIEWIARKKELEKRIPDELMYDKCIKRCINNYHNSEGGIRALRRNEQCEDLCAADYL